MRAIKKTEQTASHEALMESLGVLSFSDADFDRALGEIAAAGSFLGRGDSTEFLSVVMRWRRFFTPSALYGHRLGENVSILWRFPFADHDDLLVADCSRITKNAVLGEESVERIRKARERRARVIGFFGGSTVQGCGARLPQFSIPAQVERIIALRHRSDVVCLNYGIAGWTCVESLRLLINEAGPSLDLAVFYDGWNCCNELYLLALASRNNLRESGQPFVFPGMSLRQFEQDLVGERHYSACGLGIRSFRLNINRLLTRIADAFKGSEIRGVLNSILQRYFSISDGRLLRERLNRIALSADEEISVVTQVAEEYMCTHEKIARWCRASQIRLVHALQPLLTNSTKVLTKREESFRDSGFPWGRPHVPAQFRDAVRTCPGMVDLSDVFNDLQEEVFVDVGHLNMRGNFHVALRLADLVTGELGAMDSGG